MKVKAKEKNGVVTVKVLIKHPMHTGLQRDKKGEVVPAHFIQFLSASYEGQQVFKGELSGSLSRDPFFRFSFRGEKGKKVELSWVDNLEKGESKAVDIK